MKYLVTVLEGEEVIFVFPRSVDHDRMKEAMEAIRFGTSRDWRRKLRESEVIAAGFVTNGRCHGKSETLDLESRGEVDTNLLRSGFAIPPAGAQKP